MNKLMDKPKPICPTNFFEVGGITSPFYYMLMCLETAGCEPFVKACQSQGNYSKSVQYLSYFLYRQK